MLCGVYQHYKGGLFWVYGIIENKSDSSEMMVLYSPLYSPHQKFVRSITNFMSSVKIGVDSKVVQRFEFISEEQISNTLKK